MVFMVIPFFVADRPVSLRILKCSGIEKYNAKMGIMAHANTSKNFQYLFNIYPCSDECEISSECEFPYRICDKGLEIKNRTIKMCDSGVWTKNGCMLSYYELFERYNNMGVNYGVIIDVLKDKEKTLESAKEAIMQYEKNKYNFKLVGVAQGVTLEDYLECYEVLMDLGYNYIAVGGLLKKNENTVRYVRVRDKGFMLKVLSSIREKYPSDWLFALGCYHPKRHDDFKKMKLFGSDYKGWIFNYTKNNSLDKKQAQMHRFKQIRTYLNEKVYGVIDDE